MEDFEKMSLGRVLAEGAGTAPQKTALVCGDQRKTYKELNEMSDALAASFSRLGFAKGDRVAVYMKSSVEFILTFYALEKIGAVVAWVNPLYRHSEAKFILKNSGAKGVVAFAEWGGYDYLEALSSIKNDLPDLEHIILVSDTPKPGAHRFDDLLKEGSPLDFTAPQIDSQNDIAMLIYTSGTTGHPKGAMVTHYQCVNGGLAYSKGVNATHEDIFLGVLPMSHSYGCGSTLILPFLLKSTLVLVEKFSPELAFKLIEKEKITLQMAAPAHYILELNHPRRKNYDLSSLRAGLIAGQPAPKGLITQVMEEMGVYLTSFWGASEVGPGAGIMCPYPSELDFREAYIGIPIEGTRIRIVNPVTQEEVEGTEKGELTLSGWHVLKGYWNNPEETKKQIVDGWLYTGDIVSRDANGFLKIYGRTKDLINRGGYKITPYELESLIIEMDAIEQVCVVATPNPVLGENICVCIIPAEGQTVTLDDIRNFLDGKVASHKLPDELCIMSDFPKLSGGVKIKKFGKGGLSELAENDPNRETTQK